MPYLTAYLQSYQILHCFCGDKGHKHVPGRHIRPTDKSNTSLLLWTSEENMSPGQKEHSFINHLHQLKIEQTARRRREGETPFQDTAHFVFLHITAVDIQRQDGCDTYRT